MWLHESQSKDSLIYSNLTMIASKKKLDYFTF